MKTLTIILLFVSTSLIAHPEKRKSREERKQARIERRIYRATHPWDERTPEDKRHDTKALLFLAIGAGLIVKTISGE